MDKHLQLNKKCKLALFLLMSVAGMMKGYAYSFSADCPTGQTLYYNIINSTQHYVEITYPGTNNSFPWNGFTKPTGSITLPSTVTYNGLSYTVKAIGDYAFKQCNNLTGSLTIPNSVTTIGDNTFQDCWNLDGYLYIPNSVTSIGNNAFKDCYKLIGSLTLNSVVTIGDYAFSGCEQLKGQLTLSNSLISIGNGAFDSCGFTYSLNLPNSLHTIGEYAFSNCSGFSGSLSIPNSVTSIGKGAFSCCYGFTGTLTLPNSISIINDRTFSNCYHFTGMLTIPNSVTAIGNYAFFTCNGFTGLNISDAITTIGNSTFQGCVGLTGSLTIPNSVTSIGEYAFSSCCFTGSLTIGSSVINVGDYAFYNCLHFTSMTVFPETPPILGTNTFQNVPKHIPVYVPCGTSEAYGTAAVWSSFTNLQGYNCLYISAMANPDEGGFVVGSGEFEEGSICMLMATANDGYQFVNWTENGEEVSNDATYSFTVTCDRTLVANFSEIPPDNHWTSITGTQYNLTMSGLIYIDGVAQTSTALEIGAFCGDECRGSARAQYFPPTGEYVVSLAVVSNQQSGETITFRLYDHETQQEFPSECVNSITFVANANFGEMGNWYSFAFNNTVAIAAMVTPEGSGAVEGIGDYLIGTSCTLTATANTGYTFVNWTRNGTVVSTNASYTFTVTEACSYVAHFQLNSYQITASATPSAGGSVSGAGTYNHGSNCTLTATNNTGYTFVNWTENGTVVSTNASYTFTVTGAGSYVAHFQLNSYQITASATPSAGGSVLGSGTYSYGSSCTLTATNSTGYTFVNWTENGEVVSTDNPYTFTVNGAVELTANFSLDSYEITAIADPTAGGTISGTGTYNHFSSCTLTATTNTSYAFRSWNVNGETVSTENPYTFTVSGAVELTANFDAQETTTLDNGWTWWSTSIEMSDFDGLTMLEESLGHNGLMIKSANKFVQNYYPSTGYDYWFGQLTSDDFTNASSYMIQTSASCEVTMTGTYADPSDHPIQLYPGWTWIGYPCGTEQSAASAFANFTPTVNDKVKSQYAFSTYYDNYGWFPEFTMTPGEGYLYQSLASNTRTLTFANGSKDNLQEANEEDRYWRNNIHAYADNMNVIAVVTVDSVEQQGEDLELGAFVDGECRGSAVLKHFIPTGRWYAMLTVMGTDGDQIEFGIIDNGKGLTSMTSDRSLVFQANAVVGELDEPYTIGFGTLGCVENNLMGAMHIYPNPIDRNTAFSIVIPETETVRSIYIVNMMGEVMAHETNMTRSLSIQAPSVYTIKVECHSGNVYVGKLIVK